MANDLITIMADQCGIDRTQYWHTIKATAMPSGASNEQILTFLAVAREYGLNPLTKEIYAFPSKGGIQPIVSVDGWLKLANKNPKFDGLDTEEIHDESGSLVAVKCSVYRKDRSHPVTATEYLSECRRNTEPWKQWPARMLTNKAMIQAIRRAFSFAGIVDPDEAERIKDAEYSEVKESPTSRAEQVKAALGVGSAAGTSGAVMDDTAADSGPDDDGDSDQYEHGEGQERCDGFSAEEDDLPF